MATPGADGGLLPGDRTIYDTYPLSLRGCEGPPALSLSLAAVSVTGPLEARALRSWAGGPSSEDTALASIQSLTSSAHSGALDAGDGLHVRMGSSRGSSLLCSTFGKLQSEVFETKERSKVLSALRHRAKAAGTRRAHTPLAPSKFTADDVVRAGVLTKQGSWRRNWKTVRALVFPRLLAMISSI
jgi:hypothetical protein